MPTQEQFDAMHDAAFTDWWDAFVARVQEGASEESTVEDAFAQRSAAFDARWS